MRQYLDLVRDILENGQKDRPDRTGVGTRSVFGRQLRFDLNDGFPLVTTKKCHLRSIIHELLWFLSGETNIAYLKENGVSIWDEWADENGELGPVYGKQWRAWPTAHGDAVDQIAQVVERIKKDPYSRRLIVSAWNPGDIPKVAPTACHTMFQLYVQENKLSLQLYQRSADVMLGVPFNIASYALLLMMFAQVCELEPHEFVHCFGDAHIYMNHIEGAKLQLEREPRALPKMVINPEVKDIFGFRFEDFKLQNYNPHPHIKFDIAV